MSHHLLEQSVTNEPSPFTRFFYPQGMFADSQTTINVLVSWEDAFIAACLVGVAILARLICVSPLLESWALKATIVP